MSYHEIVSLFDQWNESLSTLDPEEVLKNYAEDAVLLPTLSNKVCCDRESIGEYFKNFLEKKPRGKLNHSVVQEYGDIATHSGIYTFYFDRREKPNKVMARFSFSYRKRDNEWLIVGHHSSLMPEPESESELDVEPEQASTESQAN